jgi:hypothetical protein
MYPKNDNTLLLLLLSLGLECGHSTCGKHVGYVVGKISSNP